MADLTVQSNGETYLSKVGQVLLKPAEWISEGDEWLRRGTDNEEPLPMALSMGLIGAMGGGLCGLTAYENVKGGYFDEASKRAIKKGWFTIERDIYPGLTGEYKVFDAKGMKLVQQAEKMGAKKGTKAAIIITAAATIAGGIFGYLFGQNKQSEKANRM